MKLTLDPETEELVAKEVREGHFESREALLNTAVRHFLVARKYGEAEANKLALLREELRRADAQIDTGECTEYNAQTLPSLFVAIRQTALRRLGKGPVKSQ
jgi:Arc/MetJ-type ribon-helix-helix transcriptional regulator